MSGRLESGPGGLPVLEERGLVGEQPVGRGVRIGHRRGQGLLDGGVDRGLDLVADGLDVDAALESPMPEGETATDRVFADEPALLEDGNAPWSGFKAESA